MSSPVSEFPIPEFTAHQLTAGERMFAKPWIFTMGTPTLESLPPADRPEIAFAGRSNVGKSSLINALVGQHGLARTSNTPGRTQELNFFTTEGLSGYLVDMPGYGYAKAPKDKVDNWTALVRDYLRGRQTLKRVFVLVDARHGLKKEDEPVMDLLDEAAVSYQIVLTKSDKISAAALPHLIAGVSEEIAQHGAAHPLLHVTSAERRQVDTLRAEIAILLS